MNGGCRSTADDGFPTKPGDGIGSDDILFASSSDRDGPLRALLTGFPPLLEHIIVPNLTLSTCVVSFRSLRLLLSFAKF